MKRFKRVLKWLTTACVALIVLACVAPYLISIEQPAPPELPFPNSQFASIDGLRTHYRVWSPPVTPRGNVLLVHGFCGSTFSWRKNVDALVETGYRVAAIDLQPFGYSERKTGINHSSTARAQRCWELANTIDSNATWFLFGHSMGGGVIGAMAQQHPDKVAGLVFVDGAAGLRRPSEGSVQEKIFATVMRLGPVRRWTEVIAKYRMFQPDHIKELLTGAYSMPADDEAVQGYLATLRVPGTASGILDMFSSRDDTPESASAEIVPPTLIVWGETDQWIPLRVGESLNQKIAGSQLEKISGAGHCPMETHPKEFNKTVIEFMNARIKSPDISDMSDTSGQSENFYNTTPPQAPPHPAESTPVEAVPSQR